MAHDGYLLDGVAAAIEADSTTTCKSLYDGQGSAVYTCRTAFGHDVSITGWEGQSAPCVSELIRRQIGEFEAYYRLRTRHAALMRIEVESNLILPDRGIEQVHIVTTEGTTLSVVAPLAAAGVSAVSETGDNITVPYSSVLRTYVDGVVTSDPHVAERAVAVGLDKLCALHGVRLRPITGYSYIRDTQGEVSLALQDGVKALPDGLVSDLTGLEWRTGVRYVGTPITKEVTWFRTPFVSLQSVLRRQGFLKDYDRWAASYGRRSELQ